MTSPDGSQQPVRLAVRDGTAALSDPLTTGLRNALRAIPGVVVELAGWAWALRIGPDRAASLLRLAEVFELSVDEPSLSELRALAAHRSPDDPVVEITRSGGLWLSLLDDCSSLAVEELRAVPGARHVANAARLEIPLTGATARALQRTIRAHRLRLSPAADLALQETLAEAPDGGEPTWIARAEIQSSGPHPQLTISTKWGQAPEGLTQLEQSTRYSSRVVAPLSAANLRTLAGLLDDAHQVSLAPATDRALSWLAARPDADAVPPAELDLVGEKGDVRVAISSIWDTGPESDFFLLETAVLRRHRQDSPDAQHLPPGAWPPDELARFIARTGVTCTSRAEAFVRDLLVGDADAQRLLELSRAADADLVVEGLGGELMPFQRAGVAYALERRRVFLADEQGLGKTVQALATVQADLAYPAIVVCPASLKLNWLRETGAWLPSRRARVIDGRGAQDLEGAELVIINYEVVEAHLDTLEALLPRALILDESHYVKSPKAARTRAVLDLADRLEPGALRLALTGTPVVNRPAELAPQLRVLDRLDEYGSARSFSRGYRTSQSRRMLHERLRSSCFLRRRKEDVLEQLPAKRRAVVTLPITNEAEYERAERHFVRWLNEQRTEDGSPRLLANVRTEAIVRLTALRRLAARGKLEAAIAWLKDFVETEESLVVFAHHREIQDAVLEEFPSSARLVGADSMVEREENVRRFQAENGPGLCVCSMEVASHGFTLTRSANVAFLELAWTPAKHDQAEDRIHRIGQTQSATAWYLLAAKTIDERMAELIEAKREVIDALTDGGEGGGASLVDALVEGYSGG